MATLFCRCESPCNGTLSFALGGESIPPVSVWGTTASEFSARLGALRALHGDSTTIFPEPIRVRASGSPDGRLCSVDGTRTTVEFLRDAGDVPPLTVDSSEVNSKLVQVHFETNQTLNCSCANCGGSFSLWYDGRETDSISHDATAAQVQAALLKLPTLNKGDVRVSSAWGTQLGLCEGDDLVVSFTTPLGNQPPLVPIVSLLESGAPGGSIHVFHPTGTRERETCNAAGFCDKAGNVTLNTEETSPKPTNGTCACDEGFEFDADFGSCGRPQFNTSAWTGFQRAARAGTPSRRHLLLRGRDAAATLRRRRHRDAATSCDDAAATPSHQHVLERPGRSRPPRAGAAPATSRRTRRSIPWTSSI